MMNRMYRAAFIASLSAIAVMIAANETLARSGAAVRGGFTAHSISHRSLASSFRHHRRNNAAIVWPAEGDFSYGPSNGEPIGDVTQPTSGDIHYTYTQDVPWDWAHRYPPAVAPSDRPYVPSCPTETVTFPRHDGGDQTVSVMRCY
jgi:hypothetical protein